MVSVFCGHSRIIGGTMDKVKKIGKYLFSMRFALLLLVLMAAACIVGSIIPQGEVNAYYTNNYSEKFGMLIILIGLDDVFHTAWFAVLTAFLCLNLLGCNIIRFPQLTKQLRDSFRYEKAANSFAGEPDLKTDIKPEILFKAMGFKQLQGNENAVYSVRHKGGVWGAWLTHVGMLIIILGFALGQMYAVQYTVYGVSGQTKPVGDTGYLLTIDDYNIGIREDQTVEQYTSRLTMTDIRTGTQSSGETSVNHPLTLNGYKLYQNSTGWAANVSVFKNDELIQTELLCAGEYLKVVDNEKLVVVFNALYPDYAKGYDGMPYSASPYLNNPGYLYSVYYNGQMIGMNVLIDDYISIDDYTVIFTDPQQYTLIQLKHDPFTWLALLGGVFICAALFIAFYYRVEELYAVSQDESWLVYARSRKGGVLFKDKLFEKAESLKQSKEA